LVGTIRCDTMGAMRSLDIGGYVVLVVSLHELDTIKRGLVDTMNIMTPDTMEDIPTNRPALWAQRRARELMAQMPEPFKCKAFVYAGPGHQSKHECEIESIHPIEGEHRDFNTEWEGTARYAAGGMRLEFNPKHRNDGCGCSGR
jgi:hypothetical protein